MNPRDRELLNKQFPMRTLSRRDDGAAIWIAFAVVYAVLAFGGLVYAYSSGPSQTASTEALIALLNGSPQSTQLR
jgi:hypothetical protein